MSPELQGNGIVTRQSRFPFDETVSRLIGLIESRHGVLFATIDHAGEAARAGFAMRPTKVLIFGSSRTFGVTA